MKEFKLISMTSFVEWIGNRKEHESYEKDLALIYNYCTFLKQSLKLEMFVPCDDSGNVLEEYKISTSEREADLYNYPRLVSIEEHNWEKAKEKVLFEGFIPCITNNIQSVHHEKTTVFFQLRDGESIESISRIGQIQLTPTAIKQIGL